MNIITMEAKQELIDSLNRQKGDIDRELNVGKNNLKKLAERGTL